MTPIPARPLWSGRALVLVGIVLMALNLRTAVAAISPIVPFVSADIPLDSVALGIIGMLPPIAFAVSGILAPMVARRLGLEFVIVLACLAMLLGHLVRALAGGYGVLVLGSVVALGGMGFANILLPPAVKKYFPDRIGQLTSLYATVMALGASIPPLIAAPVATAAGWRVSVGMWAVLALFALAPWIGVWLRHRRDARVSNESIALEPEPELVGRLWHSRVAWAMAVTFAVTSLNVYALFAWLPVILGDVSGTSDVESGALLSLYALIGLPFALLVPVIVSRMRSVAPLIWAAFVFFVAGYLGLLLLPTVAPWLWVLLAGSGPLLFPLCLVLINLRTRSPRTSTALSGFVQSIGYGIGALGPLLVGVIHTLTNGWTAPLVFLLATSLVSIAAGVVLARPLFVEDELAARAERL